MRFAASTPFRLLGAALPGLALAAWYEHLFNRYNIRLEVYSQFGLEVCFGTLFGSNPYIYYIGGLYAGVLLFLLFQTPKLKRVLAFRWEFTLIAGGCAIFLLQDMLLLVSIASLWPGGVLDRQFHDKPHPGHSAASSSAKDT